jgi:hypothetical protein
MTFFEAIWSVPSWGNATLIELLWATAGLLVSSITFAYLIQVLRAFSGVITLAVREEPSVQIEVLVLLAWGYVRREALRLATGLLILSVGILASLTPTPGGIALVSVTGLVLTSALFGIAFSVALQSVLDGRQRLRAEALLNDRHGGVA